MGRVSNKDLAKILKAVESTTGYTVEYRGARAKVTGPHGRSEFIKIGSSGFFARDVERQLRSLGWPPEVVRVPVPAPPPAPLVLPEPEVRMVSVPDPGDPEYFIDVPEEPPAPAREDPPMTTQTMRAQMTDAAWRFLKARLGETFTADELAAALAGHHTETSVATAINTEYRQAGPDHPWLHIHRSHTRPQRYWYSDTPREPWEPKALRGTTPVAAAVQPQGPVATVLAELPDGGLLLRTGDGTIWRAAKLGTTPRGDLDDLGGAE